MTPTKATMKTPTRTLTQIKLSRSKRMAFKIKIFSSKKSRKKIQDLEWKEQAPKRALDPKDQHSKLRPSLSTRSRHQKIPGEESKHIEVRSTPKDQTFKLRPLQTRRKHLNVLGEESKHLTCAINPEDQTSKSKIKAFKLKISPWRRRSNKRTLHLFICNKY